MSTDIAHLAIRLDGPLQSWGYDSQYSRRNTGLYPTKSAILGMCCAAMGIPRGSEFEAETLEQLRRLQFLAISIPRVLMYRDSKKELSIRRIVDYHTVLETRNAKGDIKNNAHLTWRYYLCDAAFGAVLRGEKPIIEKTGSALKNPVWGVWLGRKACIPTAPVYVGIYKTEEDALDVVLQGQGLNNFSYQREVENFLDGTDSLSDQPLCYGGLNGARAFAPRRIKLNEGKI